MNILVSDDELSKITLIMYTYNRPDYAFRGMRYWADLGVKLHVMDGSTEPISQSILDDLPDNVVYHFEPVGICERIRRALAYIDTPYSAFVADDEFFLRSGLLAAIRYLDKNTEYAACGGQALSFSAKEGVIFAEKEYPKHAEFNLSSDYSRDRVLQHFSDYTPATMYAVVRSDCFIKAASLFTEHEFSAFAVWELQFEFSIAWMGKTRILDNIHWLRSSENPPTRNTDPSMFMERRVHDWWRNPDNRDETDYFVSIMVKHLSDERYSQDDVAQAVRRAMDLYASFLDSYYVNKQHLLLRIARGLIHRFRYYIGWRPRIKQGVYLMNTLDQFETSIADEARPDLQQINDMLLVWHASRGARES